MASEENHFRHSCLDEQPNLQNCYLKKFKLYETPSNFYMIGRDKSRTGWRVLKIDRLEPFELNIFEDPTTYSEHECYELLRMLHEGNKGAGGLKLLTICYGIIGFVRFLGPYYMIIITKRRKIGTICGHTIYGISKSKMIPLPTSTERSKLPYSKDENRSFVHSACKCNMYMVLLRRNTRVASSTRHSLNVLRTVSSCGYVLLVSIKLSWGISLVSYHFLVADNYAEQVNFVLYLLLKHLQCGSDEGAF